MITFLPLIIKPNSRRRLKPGVIPSVFPWTLKVFQRHSINSVKALSTPEYATDEDDDSASDIVADDASNANDFDQQDVGTSLLDQIEQLQLQVKQLQAELAESKINATKSLLRLENIKEKDDLVKFYTGFSDYTTLVTFYQNILEDDAAVMRQWDSRRCKESGGDVKHGPSCKLPLLEQLFMTLRLGLHETDLAIRFGVSQSTVSRITTIWINLMYHHLDQPYVS